MSQYDIELDDAVENTSHALILDLVGHNKRVLDIGCSTGYLARVLVGRGCTVTGVEIDPEAAAKAAEVCERVVVGSLDDLDLVAELGAGQFDVLVLGDVLEHLVDPTSVLRRLTPLLRAGGSVVVSVPNITHASIRLSLLEGRFDYTEVGLLDRTHVHFFTRASLQRLLRECGLVPVDMRRTVADAQATEIPVDLSRFPAEVVDQLARDRDATTYQFVCRSVLDDSGSAVAELAERMEAAQLRLHEQEVALGSATGSLTEQLARNAALEQELESTRRDRDRLQGEQEHLVRVVAQLQEQLKAPRVLLRNLAGAARGRASGAAREG